MNRIKVILLLQLFVKAHNYEIVRNALGPIVREYERILFKNQLLVIGTGEVTANLNLIVEQKGADVKGPRVEWSLYENFQFIQEILLELQFYSTIK